MPEQFPTTNPLIFAGTPFESGTPNTAQLRYAFGGTHQFSVLSGATTDVRIWNGAGRLETAQTQPILSITQPAASGVAVVFYDAAVPSPNGTIGPIPGSGHKLLGMLLPSNTGSGLATPGELRTYRTVFTSGLCVSQASGQFGFTCNFTPVVSG